jgi:hypothetical protein
MTRRIGRIAAFAMLLSQVLAAQPSYEAVSESISKTWELAADDRELYTNRIPALARFSHLEGDTPLPASFAAGFSDYSVLQRETAAAIYGMPGSPFTLPATVQVNITSTSDGYAKSYEAKVTKASDHGEWKVVLESKPAGGDYTITAACTSGCSNSSSTSIQHVTFGDLW